jgi:exonuclease SbcC
MIPVTLTIQGLYSYKQKQNIDFSKLTAAGLFGIFGSVGCGKSTILEAISYALYGETERLNKGDNRNYNMMNLKSNELLIDFEFKTGNDIHYRFIVKGKRNGKKFEEVKTFDRTAYKWENNDWTPIEVKSAEEIIGLNYDNFRRTIIIPQGKFQEFLQLNPKDRTNMLMELFNLNKFELSGKVIALENKNNAEIQNLTGQLQSIGEIHPEEIEAKEKALNEMVQNLTIKETEYKQIEAQQKELEVIKAIYAKIETQQNKLAELKKQESEIQTIEKEITEFEQFTLLFKSDFDQLKQLEISKERTNNELNLLRKQKEKTQAELETANTLFEKTLQDYSQKELLLTEAAELLKLKEIRQKEEENTELNRRIANGQKFVDEKTALVTETKIEQQKLTDKIATTRQEMPDLSILAEIKTWFTNNKNFSTALQTSTLKFDEYNKKLQAEKQKGTELALKSGISDTTTDNFSSKDLADFLENKKKATDTELDKLNQKAIHSELQKKLEEFASDLHEGKACPLCGSTHHPAIFNAQNISTELQLIKTEQEQLKKLIQEISETERTLTTIAANIKSIERQLVEEKAIKDDCKTKLSHHALSFTWNNYSPNNEAQLEADFEKAKLMQAQLNELEISLRNITNQLVTNEAEKEKFTKALAGFEQQKTINQSHIDLLEKQITHLNTDIYTKSTKDELQAKSEELTLQHTQITAQYQQQEKQIAILKETNATLDGSIKANEENLKNIEANYHKFNEIIKQKLQSNNISQQQVETILSKQLNINALKQRIITFKTETESCNNILQQLENERNGRTYDTQLHINVNEQLSTLNQQLTLLNQQIGTNRSQLERLKSDNERFGKLRTELDKLELRASDINEMKLLFRGSAFVNYISTVYLENLCKAANERFYTLTRQRLSLELTEDNSFQVRDFINEGKVRNVKTLSGGQTFQASLSLALALADSIHKIAGNNENFFFLDEGFGTLDKDSLSTVFDTLKSLRHENRIVGLISHVEEMQQEITTFLSIENKEDTGSVIHNSWS